eukprot:1160325-Pelagomonas_calceolata.AAC.17
MATAGPHGAVAATEPYGAGGLMLRKAHVHSWLRPDLQIRGSAQCKCISLPGCRWSVWFRTDWLMRLLWSAL